MGMFKHNALLGATAAVMLLLGSQAEAAAIRGAIYTSQEGGETVNANLYEAKDLVFLNGGPNNSRCRGGELENGEFYFQVTNPSGSDLLSQTPIEARSFRTEGGRIVEYTGTPSETHYWTPNTHACGGISIQLVPYADTPNMGGVYKVWITRVDDYVPGSANHGFSGSTKTDNFRIREQGGGGEEDSGTLNVYKFYDLNANGEWDDGEMPLEGWPIRIDPLTGNAEVNEVKYTDVDGLASWSGLLPSLGTLFYTVEEGMPEQANWFSVSPNPVDGVEIVVDETTIVEFGNFCLVPSGGRTLGFWSNPNGRNTLTGLPGWQDLLYSHWLRNANGTRYQPTHHEQFRAWLLNASATNMAYMLSAQLAATVLNVEAGFVDGGAFYIPYDGTINELIATATLELESNGLTVSGRSVLSGGVRSVQEKLKNHLDALNNGAEVVASEPCDYTFENPFADDINGGEAEILPVIHPQAETY